MSAVRMENIIGTTYGASSSIRVGVPDVPSWYQQCLYETPEEEEAGEAEHFDT